jgi:hypothetical protein
MQEKTWNAGTTVYMTVESHEDFGEDNICLFRTKEKRDEFVAEFLREWILNPSHAGYSHIFQKMNDLLADNKVYEALDYWSQKYSAGSAKGHWLIFRKATLPAGWA